MQIRSVFGAAVVCLWGTAASAETVVLRDFTLIDGAGGQPLPRAAMIVADGRIQWVGPAARLRPPAGAQVRDLAGKFVMPGLINLHCHLANTLELVQSPANFTRANLEKHLKTYASYGVTSVLSMGSDQELVYQVRAEQRAGRPRMTRIFTAGRGFTGPAGYPTTAPGMKGVPYEVNSEAEVRKAVAQLADRRVDVVKIWVDDHLGRERKIPLAVSRAIVRYAHKHGLKVAAHIYYLADAKALIESGLDALAHSVRDRPVDEDLVAAMKKRGAWQIPTLTREASTFAYAKPHPMLSDPFFTRSVSAALLATLGSAEYRNKVAADPDFAKYPAFLEFAGKNLKRLSDAGVKIGFGTDTGPPARFAGFFEHWEMELMAQAGLTPAQILASATRDAAEFLGVSRDLGTLEAGKWADLLVLSRNPLEDVRNSRSLEAVYIAGLEVRK